MKRSMVFKGVMAMVGAGLLAGCCVFCESRRSNEVYGDGFTAFDGTITAEAPEEYFIIRYEQQAWVKDRQGREVQKWMFTELRHLASGTSLVTDGEFKAIAPRNISARNWAKYLPPHCRNVRVKFVDKDYTLENDGRVVEMDGFTPLFTGDKAEYKANWKGVTREKDFNRPFVRRALLPEERWELQAKADKLAEEHWYIRDGALFFDGREGGYSLATKKDYGNFEMYADWRLLRVFGDSGFYLRGLYQIQIWDPNMWNGLGSGGIWNNPDALFNATRCADRPIGDWNRCRIRMVGEKVTVWLNGVKVVDDVQFQNGAQKGKPLPLMDQIELQCHGDPIEFRNIFIRELPEADEDIPDPEAAVRGEQVDLLKDGIAGWEAVDPKARMGWTVKDGVLSNNTGIDPAKTSRGGAGTTHLRTKLANFYDFDLSYDVLVPARCNSGVYLRGRYEIQVLDSYGRRPDTHTMCALYDLTAPTESAEKKPGEWQHVDLTLYKRHLTVKLNGKTVIDNQPVKGVTPGAIDGDEFVSGPILLQGDHSNTSFRNMVLTRIEQ